MSQTFIINLIGNLIGWGMYFLVLRRLPVHGLIKMILALAFCYVAIQLTAAVFRRLH